MYKIKFTHETDQAIHEASIEKATLNANPTDFERLQEETSVFRLRNSARHVRAANEPRQGWLPVR